MTTLVLETEIAATKEKCFDLARDITFHCSSAVKSKERAVAGVTYGLIGMGEWVTFEAVHFGIKQRFTAKITEFESPSRFVDQMVHGAFKSMKHVHEFTPTDRGTLMRDTICWVSPFGILGKLADKLFLYRHMRNFLMERNAILKAKAENLERKADNG